MVKYMYQLLCLCCACVVPVLCLCCACVVPVFVLVLTVTGKN